MEAEAKYEKFDVFIGHRKSRSIAQPLRVGNVKYDEEKTLYILRLAHLPISYFMQKNRENEEQFTVFARIVNRDQGFKLTDPIGKANLVQELKDYMEITIPMLPRKLYMSLFPTNHNQSA